MTRKAVAVLLSGVFPGLGQLYNREWAKGVALAVAGVVLSWYLAQALASDLDSLAAAIERPEALAVRISAIQVGATIALLLIWLWSVVDAWRRA